MAERIQNFQIRAKIPYNTRLSKIPSLVTDFYQRLVDGDGSTATLVVATVPAKVSDIGEDLELVEELLALSGVKKFSVEAVLTNTPKKPGLLISIGSQRP